MGREILFRGKQKSDGEWIFGNLLQTDDDGTCIIQNHVPHHLLKNYVVDPGSIGQYTGLTDKNGRKIFEGDILFVVEKMGSDVFQDGILINSPRWVNKTKFKVEFTPGGLMNVQRFCNSKDIECELIGNIFDNPELLNQ